MSVSLKVTGIGENSDISFQIKELSKDDVQVVKNTIKEMREDKPRAYFAKSLLMPVRTHSLPTFCSDFFLPVFINLVLKADSLAEGLIRGVLVTLDVITFPVRVVTAIPRWVYNQKYPKESNLMYQLLKRLGAPAKLLDQDVVEVSIKEDSKQGPALNRSTVSFTEFPLDAVKIEVGSKS